jgi:hypothetical protein
MIGHEATPPVLPPSDVLPPLLSHRAFIPARKISAHLKMPFQLFTVFKLR